ncbi:MAG TPA: MFS transporter [Sphingomonadaceae bacterium]
MRQTDRDSAERQNARSGGNIAGSLTGGAVVAVLFMGSTLLTPLYDIYRTRFGFSTFTLVLLYAVYVIGNLASLLFLGRLSDKLGRKPVVLLSIGLAVLSNALFLLANGAAWLFAGRIVNGLAVGLGSGAATAWIAEFTRPERRDRAASVMTAFNFIGLALGAFISGILVQHAPHPIRLPFAAYLGILALVTTAVFLQPETVARSAGLSFAPRIGIPAGTRRAFVAPAAAGFGAMSVVGFYAALGPTTIRVDLDVTDRALAAAIVAELFVIATLVIFATRQLAARTVMLGGLAAVPVGMALLVAAQQSGSILLMHLGTVFCGIAGALGYRGGLAVVNLLAPPDRRAELASAFFICCFCGNALPIIGVGALSQATSPHLADAAFAVVVSAIAGAALLVARSGRPAV